MPAITVDIRQLRHRKRPATAVVEPVIAAPVAIQPQPTPLVAALGRMVEKNPLLGKLMATLDLDPQTVELPAGHQRLWDLAGQSLVGGRMYTRPEAVEQIRLQTKVTTERAEAGFALMVGSRAIEPTINPALFYLGGTTPF